MWLCSVCQGYAVGLVEPLYGATENSRGSDLSDILEEEEEDMYSDPPGPTLARGYTTGADRVNIHYKHLILRILLRTASVFVTFALLSLFHS